jgi:cold-inducible RNA-binding protein
MPRIWTIGKTIHAKFLQKEVAFLREKANKATCSCDQELVDTPGQCQGQFETRQSGTGLDPSALKKSNIMGNKLYVGNLSFNTTEIAIQDLFSQCGSVSEVMLMQDKFTGRSRGFAFVTMESDEAAQAAVNQLHGKELDGRALTINEARPREDRPPGGGGGGGFGGPRREFRGGGGGGGRDDRRGGGGYGGGGGRREYGRR